MPPKTPVLKQMLNAAKPGDKCHPVHDWQRNDQGGLTCTQCHTVVPRDAWPRRRNS